MLYFYVYIIVLIFYSFPLTFYYICLYTSLLCLSRFLEFSYTKKCFTQLITFQISIRESSMSDDICFILFKFYHFIFLYVCKGRYHRLILTFLSFHKLNKLNTYLSLKNHLSRIKLFTVLSVTYVKHDCHCHYISNSLTFFFPNNTLFLLIHGFSKE